MKKVLVLFTCIALVIMTAGFSPANASTAIEKELLQNFSKEDMEFFVDFKKNGGKIDYLNDEQRKELLLAEEKTQDVYDYQQKLLENFEVVDISNEQLSLVVKDENGVLYSDIKGYKDGEGSHIITTTVYNPTNGEIVSFIVDETTDDKPNLETIYQYTGDAPIELSKTFKWNGKTFVCGAIGIVLCTTQCGAWALIHPGAGVVCGLACNAAFVIACM